MTTIRLTRNLTTDLALWMGFLGMGIGLSFPFFLVMIGIEPAIALAPTVFAATVAAGLLVAGMNFLIARGIVAPRLRDLVHSMRQVSSSLQTAQFDDDWSRCHSDQCKVAVNAQDSIGAVGMAFNGLLDTLFRVQSADEKMRGFARTITTRLDVAELGQTTIDFMLNQMAASGAALFVETSGELGLVKSHGIDLAQDLCTNARLLRTMESREPLVVDLPDDMILDGVLARFRPRQVLLIPLRFHNQPLGVLLFAADQVIEADTRGLLSMVANGLALSLNNAIIHDRLERIAALDALTGVYNRRFGIQRLDEEFSRVLRNDAPLALVMFDIDHFKRVNDTYGHLAGDRVIRSLTKAAGSSIREGDVLVRYGGEEFLAILPGASMADAAEIAERIRHMSNETVCYEQEQQIRFSVSLGYAAFPQLRVSSAEDLLRSADQALYAAKEGGRNCAVAAKAKPG